ncbi:hypothetical protein Tco_0403724 [Tanacetum coccineum]
MSSSSSSTPQPHHIHPTTIVTTTSSTPPPPLPQRPTRPGPQRVSFDLGSQSKNGGGRWLSMPEQGWFGF